MQRKTDAFITGEVTSAFDAKTADLSGPKVAAVPPPQQLAPSLQPIVVGEPVKPKPAATPSWGDHALVRDLISAPVSYIARKTLLRSPDTLKKFLADGTRTRRYLSHPLIKGVLDDPKVLKWVVVNRAVMQGFLASPAMQDKTAVAMLAKSDLLKAISKARGAQAVFQDPGFAQMLLVDPQAQGWLMKNPAAIDALKDLMPALAKSAGTTRRR
jgi:hypothetical protein